MTYPDLIVENHLSNILNIKVDLVTKKALKPYIGKKYCKKSIMSDGKEDREIMDYLHDI